MQIANRLQLDTDRLALLDSFDAIWLAESEITQRGTRAIRCASRLNRGAGRGVWFIGNGYRWTQGDCVIRA